jgi:hypothetical protein
VADGHDPVRARRARARRWAALGARVGYGALVVAIAAFVVGAVTGFPPTTVTIVVVALVAASVVLAPAIIVGYGVRAADREDRAPRRLL